MVRRTRDARSRSATMMVCRSCQDTLMICRDAERGNVLDVLRDDLSMWRGKNRAPGRRRNGLSDRNETLCNCRAEE